MLYAAGFRSIARDALRGRWGLAVVAGIIAAIFRVAGTSGSNVEFDYNLSTQSISLNIFGQTVVSDVGGQNAIMFPFILNELHIILAVAVVFTIVLALLGCIIRIGYARFNLDLVNDGEPNINNLFSYFSYWKTAICTALLKDLYILLWSLLFIIPGIIASYSYAMTGFILAENPELTAGEAISISEEIMSGNRWRLFCLHISFIGWDILCGFTFGIGNLCGLHRINRRR